MARIKRVGPPPSPTSPPASSSATSATPGESGSPPKVSSPVPRPPAQAQAEAPTTATTDAAGRRRRPRRGKSSSVRGKEFRARRRAHEAQLVASVAALEREIRDKEFLRAVWQAKCLRSRLTAQGSLARTICEYYALFRHGLRSSSSPPPPLLPGVLPASAREHMLRQERFSRSILDPEVIVGENAATGPEASLRQWRMHTRAFPRSCVEILDGPHVFGTDEQPLVVVTAQATALLARQTFEMVFPHALADDALVRRLCGRTVRFRCTGRFYFGPTGQVVWENPEIDFVSGFLGVGLTIDEVAFLLGEATLLPPPDGGDVDAHGCGGRDGRDADAADDGARVHEIEEVESERSALVQA